MQFFHARFYPSHPANSPRACRRLVIGSQALSDVLSYLRDFACLTLSQTGHQASALQALPLFSWMGMRDAHDFLHGSCLQLLEDGAVLAAAADAWPGDSSLVHIIVAGKAASTLAIGVVSSPDSSTPQHAAAQGPLQIPMALRGGSSSALVRELGPGVAVGLSSMALQRPNRANVHCVGPCLVLTTESGNVRKACENSQGQQQLGLLETASKEAARQEDVLASLARSSLQTLSNIHAHLASLLPPLLSLDSFRSALSKEGAAPPRKRARLRANGCVQWRKRVAP